MKKFLIILTTIIIACNQNENNLISGNWKVVEIENLSTKEDVPSYLKDGIIWSFNKNKTYDFILDNEGYNVSTSGNWELNNKKLLIITDIDTSALFIHKLEGDELEWFLYDDDTLKFYLKKL